MTSPAPRAELLHVVKIRRRRAERTGQVLGYPKTRTFAELLIDREKDRTSGRVLVGMLREANRGR